MILRSKIIPLLLVSLFFLVVSAQTVFAAEKINSFGSEINIQKDAWVLVSEKIVYDFEEGQKHGIIRESPVVYKNQKGESFGVDFEVLSVSDEKGNNYQFTKGREGESVKIKIGDPKILVTGVKTYIINYKIKGAITYFSDHDELYWNVTGNGWSVPIGQAIANVLLPLEVKEGTKTICYTGKKDSTAKNCQVVWSRPNSVVISSDRQLLSGEGLTFAVSFPKNIVAQVEPKKIVSSPFPIIILGLISFISFFYYVVSPFVLIYLWLKFGRDPKTQKPVSAWYDPPKDKEGRKLSPALVGTLVDESADEKDLVATIVDLARRGYLKIKEEDKDFLLIKRKEFKEDLGLLEYEKDLLSAIFADKDQVLTKTLKKTFPEKAGKIKGELYTILVEKGFFPENPKKVRDRFYILSAVAFFTFNIPLGVFSLLFGRVMPRKTLFGAQAKIVAQGLKNFLVSQERQLTFQEKNWYFFEKLLPFAIVFDVAKTWAERFKDISGTPPDWYEGEPGRMMTPVLFVNSLTQSTSSLQSAMTPTTTRSSSGFSSGFSGGSSGGGFGGGGGSSW